MTRTIAPTSPAPHGQAADVAGDPTIDAILTELGGAIRELRCASTQGLVRTGASMAQMHVLWLLEHHGAMPMSRLAELLDISLSTATGLVDRMAEHGLVERTGDPEDRRLVLVQPATAGRRMLEENEGVKRDRLRAALTRLDAGQLAQALESFRDFRTAIQAELGTSGPHLHHFVDGGD